MIFLHVSNIFKHNGELKKKYSEFIHRAYWVIVNWSERLFGYFWFISTVQCTINFRETHKNNFSAIPHAGANWLNKKRKIFLFSQCNVVCCLWLVPWSEERKWNYQECIFVQCDISIQKSIFGVFAWDNWDHRLLRIDRDLRTNDTSLTHPIRNLH